MNTFTMPVELIREKFLTGSKCLFSDRGKYRSSIKFLRSAATTNANITNKRIGAILSSASLGCGILIKQSGLFFAVGMFCAEIFECFTTSSIHSRTRIKLWIACMGTAVIITAHWFANIWLTYHTPFFNPPVDPNTSKNFWYLWLQHRPHAIILYTIGIATLSPAIPLACFQFRETKAQALLIISMIFILFFIVRLLKPLDRDIFSQF